MNIPVREYWRLLKRYLLSQRGAAAFMAVLLLLNTGFSLVVPQVVRSFIDSAMAGAPVALLLRTGAIYLLFQLGREVLRWLAECRVTHVAWTATNALRSDLVTHLLRLDLDFHKTHPPGELIERVDGDVEQLAYFLSDLVVGMISAVLLLVGILAVITFEAPLLGGLFLLYAVVALLILTWVQRFGPPHWRKDREFAARFWGDVGELLTATEDLQTCDATGYGMGRFLNRLRMWRPVKLRAHFWRSIWLVTALVAVAGEGLAWGIAGPMVLRGSLTLGTLYMLGHYLQILTWGPIQTIQWQLHGLQNARVNIERVQALFGTQSRLVDGDLDLPDGPLDVVFDDVWFHYQDGHNEESEESRDVLRGVSFTVKSGETLGLLGRTGSGKTTIARLLFRWYDPQQGAVKLGRVNLDEARILALRSRIGFVTQDVQLFQASLRDNLTFFDASVPDGVLRNALETLGLHEWFLRLPEGLDTPISADKLSAGEAQLVALARVFISDPDLLILDEASSRLDPVTERLLGRALDRLLSGRTAVIIAHRLQTVLRVDSIVILEDGQVIESGNRQELLDDGNSHLAHLLHIGFGKVMS